MVGEGNKKLLPSARRCSTPPAFSPDAIMASQRRSCSSSAYRFAIGPWGEEHNRYKYHPRGNAHPGPNFQDRYMCFRCFVWMVFEAGWLGRARSWRGQKAPTQFLTALDRMGVPMRGVNIRVVLPDRRDPFAPLAPCQRRDLA